GGIRRAGAVWSQTSPESRRPHAALERCGPGRGWGGGHRGRTHALDDRRGCARRRGGQGARCRRAGTRRRGAIAPTGGAVARALAVHALLTVACGTCRGTATELGLCR